MTKQRVAIVGGGMAALATAFELTQKDMQERFDITIYQMGWRLGGKAATGRDREGRVVEHGLHIWFGCYENAFRMLRAAYDEWKPFQDAKQAIKSCDDALKPQHDSAIGAGDSSNIICLNWPSMPGAPGVPGIKDAANLEPLACFSQMLEVMDSFYQQLTRPDQKQKAKPKQKQQQKQKEKSADYALPDLPIDADTASHLRSADININKYARPAQNRSIRADQCLALASEWAGKLNDNAGTMDETHLRSFVTLLRQFAKHLRAAPNFVNSPAGQFLSQLIDVGTAAIKGVVADIMIEGNTIEDLDLMDFREWLAFCGAARESIYGSPIVQALYDSMLEYCDGDKRRPSYGAGTAAQAVFRLYGTYKQAFAFEMQSGMGEVVVTPIYRVLKKRGVKFEFFMKLKRIGLDLTKRSVARIVFDRQVRLRNGGYEPTIPPGPHNGYLECWPDEPRWDQICDGDQLAKQSPDFESYWCSCPPEPDEVTLHHGRHFDTVVLAIPLGAFKKLNKDKGPCDELINASEKFRTMTETATLVPSIAVQAWCTKDTAGLGWPPAQAQPPGAATKTVISTGPDPLDIWADMTQVADYEPWDRHNRPASLHYLCGVIETDLFREPHNQEQVPTQAKERARAEAINWFGDKARYIWPKSSSRAGFDWNILFDPDGAKDEKRIDAQVYHLNVDPWNCCVATAAGSTRWRLATNASGFNRLYLAGTWIDTGFNTECIEAAVISGRQAARAISGAGFEISGEKFLRLRNDLLSMIALAAESGTWLLETVANATWSGSSAEIHRRHIAHRYGRDGR